MAYRGQEWEEISGLSFACKISVAYGIEYISTSEEYQSGKASSKLYT